jgi:branched-chain amino acid transport system substrate-binding protein
MRALLRRWPLLLVAVLAAAMMLMVACEEEEEGGEVTPGATPEVTAEADGEVTPAVEVEVQGVTDTEIKIGGLLPLSGSSASAWGVALAEGAQAYYDYINDQGGVYGRKITNIIEDNQYSGPVAAEAARKLVEQDGVFVVVGSLGTAAHMAIYEYLEENNVIDYAIASGSSKWTDPTVPTRFTSVVNYTTEGRVFGTYVYQNYDGKKLGILAQNDDFGKEGEEGVKQGLEENGADVDVVVEYYDAVQSDVTAQVQRLRNEGVDLIMFYGQPVQAASMMKAARETLSWDVPMMVCGVNALSIVATLAGLDNIEGAVSVMASHQHFETEIPVIAWLKGILEEYAPDAKWDGTTFSGMLAAVDLVMVLKQAGPDLTVDSFVAAAEARCEWMCPYCLLPSSRSPTDHYPFEGDYMVRATVDRSTDPPTFRWERFGDPITFESTKDCVQPTPPAGYDEQPGPSYYEEFDEDFEPYEP